jgi:hypothetical protein
MRPAAVLLPLVAAASACSSPVPARELPPPPAERRGPERADEIVALLNGEPLSWRAVAEKALEVNLKGAVDEYVRWRIVDERRRALGISNPAGDLRRRAEVLVRETRATMGADDFKAQLGSAGFTEASYVDYLVGLRAFEESLTREKIVRYAALTEDVLEIDRMVFSDEADAGRFAAAAREKGFDRAVDEGGGAAAKGRSFRQPRERFPRSRPPLQPLLDPWIVDALARLKPGELTGVEASRSNAWIVARLVSLRPGNGKPYPDVQGEVLESILTAPPKPEETAQWVASELARAKVEYGAPGPRKAGGR